MPVNIGPKIGLDGEAEFRKNLKNINQMLKTLGSEMKAVTSAFTENDDAQAALTAQAGVLTRQIETQEKKVQELKRGYEAAAKQLGENETDTLIWAQAVNEATATLNDLKNRLSQTEQNLNSMGQEADAAADDVTDLGDAAKESSGGLDTLKVAAGNLLADGIETLISGIGDLISSFWNLDEATEEYRKNMGLLQTAYETNGYSLETAKQAYKDLYAIIGDEGTATEAAQLMATLSQSQQDLSNWTTIAAGVWGTFGEALPINSLMEAANETSKTGQVVGVLADALNWAGISEDAFNEKLALASTESERNKLIMEALSGAYDEASEAYYRNNEELIKARENQTLLNDSIAKLGKTVSDAKNVILSDFFPSISAIVEAFSDLIGGVDGADEKFSNAIKGMADTVKENLPEYIEVGAEIMQAVLRGIADSVPGLLTELVQYLANGILEGIPKLADASLEAADSLADGLEKGTPEILQAAIKFVFQLVETIVENLPKFLEAGITILSGLLQGMIDYLPTLLEWAPYIVENLAGAIAKAIPQIIEAGFNLIMELGAAIMEALPEILVMIPGLLAEIAVALGKAAVDLGVAIVEGVWQGIKDMAGWLGEQIGNFFGGLIDGVKELLGINSPSKVFENIGKNMAAGVDVGWDKEWSGAQRQIEGTIDFSNLEAATAAIQAPSNVVYVTQDGSGTSAPDTGTGDVSQRIDVTLELDGQVLARRMYSYNRRESNLRGSSLVEVGV